MRGLPRSGHRHSEMTNTSLQFVSDGTNISERECPVDVVIQFSEREEAKALPILMRLTPGVVLPNRVYVLSMPAIRALQDAGVVFREVSRTGHATAGEGVASGERI